MAAPTTPSAPPSTSPAPASAGAQYPTPSSLSLDAVASFPPPPAYPTFVHNGVPYVYIPVPVAFLPNQSHVTARKRKRPNAPPPCTLCRLSHTPCVATRPGEACQRCIHKKVDCFDDNQTTDTTRVRHLPDDDAPDDADSEPELDQNQPPNLWQIPANGYPPSYPAQAPPYVTAAATPAKRERVIKACAECHARKRKCTGVGGPNCGLSGSRAQPVNGTTPSSARPSPRKSTPGGASGHTRMREPCAECRGRKRRCLHHDVGKDGDAADIDGPADESMHTDRDELPPSSHSSVHPRSRSPHSPPTNRWQPHPPNPYYPAPHPPQFGGYPNEQHRMPYPQSAPPFMHPHENPYAHAPPHPHSLAPPHHARLPPAPDMRHMPGCKDCRARGIQCACPDPRAEDGGSSSSSTQALPLPPSVAAKGATPAPAPPAGRKGRACLACRKLKMRCVAPNNGNGAESANPDGPDERCQRCERAGLECIYVDRKRRAPGTVFGPSAEGGTGAFDGFSSAAPNSSPSAPPSAAANGGENEAGRPPAKKLKREGTSRHASPYPTGPRDGLMKLGPNEDARMQRVNGEDAARTLEESFADEDEARA